MLGTLALMWMMIVPTPGPNSLFIVQLALTASWRDVAVALVGNLIGIAFYALVTLLGLALLLGAAGSVRLALYLLGSAYFVWCGIRLVRAGLARRKSIAGGGDAQGAHAGTQVGRPFVQGALTALSNVHALFFLTSIFASAGVLTATAGTKLASLGIVIAGNGIYLSLLAWALQRDRARAFYERHRPLMEIGFGLIFLAFGARLAGRELSGWL